MGTLTDDDLRHLLGEAAGAFAVPEQARDEVLDAAQDAEVVPLRRRRWVQLPAAAAVLALALAGGMLLAEARSYDGNVSRLAGDEVQEQVSTDGEVLQSGGRSDDTRLLDLREGAGLPAAPVTAPDSAQVGADFTKQSGTAYSGPAAGTAPAPPAAKGAAPVTAPVPDGARVVKKGAIALLVEDEQVTPTLTRVQGFASAAGGLVADAKTQESGPTPSGSVTLRVPVRSFEQVVAQVRGIGAEVRSATTSGQDVTAQYADLEAQLQTLRAARERFLEILSRARSIGDVLAVQQRVDDVTGKIDRLEGQRRVLAAQSDSATLEVTVTEADDPAVRKTEKPDDGLGKAFSDAWNGFTSGVEGLIRLSGRGILLLLCLAVAVVVLRLGWRASRRRLV